MPAETDSQFRLPDQSEGQAPLSFVGCFQEQSVGVAFPYSKPYSNALDCTDFCSQARSDNPYFLILHQVHQPQCACSSGCAILQVGSNLEPAPSSLCSVACPDNSSLFCGGFQRELTYFSVYSLEEAANSCSEMAMATPMNRFALASSFVSITFEFFAVCAVLYFVVVYTEETDASSPIPWWKKISPFNLHLTVMSVSLISLSLVIILEAWSMAQWTVVLVPFNYFFSATFKTFYLLHSWKRASSVIYSLSSFFAVCFRFLLRTAPVLMYSTVIPAILFTVFEHTPDGALTSNTLMFLEWMRILDMTAIILVASIDLSLLICFVLHIFKHTRSSETAPIERKFLAICYFGIVSNALCIIAFVAQVAQVMTVIRATRFMICQVALDAATHLVFTAVLLTLVAMKIVLRREDRLEAVELQKILRCSIATESVTGNK